MPEPDARLGFLYPDHAAEDDLPEFMRMLFEDASVVADVVHTTIGEDAHTEDALRETGSQWRLRDGARALAARGAHVALWACTSGSFVFGLDGARRQARELAEDFGGPASSTSLAFVAALAAIGARTVAVAATYPEPLARCFFALLEETGCELLRTRSHGVFTAAHVGTIGRKGVLELVVGSDHPEAEAILVPDTALHTVRWLEELELATGKPVLTANQVTVWEALRLTDLLRPCAAGGTLFAERYVAQAH